MQPQQKGNHQAARQNQRQQRVGRKIPQFHQGCGHGQSRDQQRELQQQKTSGRCKQGERDGREPREKIGCVGHENSPQIQGMGHRLLCPPAHNKRIL
jgi:hypothetical protein